MCCFSLLRCPDGHRPPRGESGFKRLSPSSQKVRVMCVPDPTADWWRYWGSLFSLSCRCRCSLEETDAELGADSTTHCVHPDGRHCGCVFFREVIWAVCPIRMCVSSGGTSQFSLMELSQSQDLCSEATNNNRGDHGFIASLPEEGATKSGRADF